MTSEELQDAIQVVGNEETLQQMLLKVREIWLADVLDGLPAHLAGGGNLESFFIRPERPGMYPGTENPEYLIVERSSEGFEMQIGISYPGDCGHGAEFRFTSDFQIQEDEPPQMTIH